MQNRPFAFPVLPFVSHTQALASWHTHRSPPCTASGPWCLIESHLSPPTESHPPDVFHRGRSDDELRGRRCRNDAGPRVGSRVTGPGAPEMRFNSDMDAECYTSKQRTRFGQYALAAGHAQIASMRSQISTATPYLHFLRHAFAFLHANIFRCDTGNMPVFFGARPPYRMQCSQGSALPELCLTR